MNKLTVGSLFSGIGGLDLGLEQTRRFEIVWQVEIDDYCQKVLAKHWPDVARFRDVRDCGAHNLCTVDVLAGGFPCQDISSAGKRLGLEGERSGLWSQFSRLICELRPRYILVENVAALLSPIRREGRTEPAPLSRILSDLAAGGYDAEWQVLPAAAFGAPHLRERVFVVAYLSGIRSEPRRPQSEGQQGASNTDGSCSPISNTQTAMAYPGLKRLEVGAGIGSHPCKECATTQRDGVQVSDSDSQRAQVPTARIFTTKRLPQCSSWWATEPDVGRVAHGVPHRVDRLRGLGDAVVPQVAQYIGACILAHEDARQEEGSAC